MELIKPFIASSVILVILALAFAIVSLARAKFMGPAAPHSCADGCESCKSHCDNYHVDELKEEIQASIKLDVKNAE
ncbi:MAG: hypothetical protein KBS66_06750 [Eubacterium sp.]|nr:hypothetical protein [Candidatus Colimonas fimequi]